MAKVALLIVLGACAIGAGYAFADVPSGSWLLLGCIVSGAGHLSVFYGGVLYERAE